MTYLSAILASEERNQRWPFVTALKQSWRLGLLFSSCSHQEDCKESTLISLGDDLRSFAHVCEILALFSLAFPRAERYKCIILGSNEKITFLECAFGRCFFVKKRLEIFLHEGLYPGDKCNHRVNFTKCHTNRVGLALTASCVYNQHERWEEGLFNSLIHQIIEFMVDLRRVLAKHREKNRCPGKRGEGRKFLLYLCQVISLK